MIPISEILRASNSQYRYIVLDGVEHTSPYTAAPNDFIFVDTLTASKTIVLPSSPLKGDKVIQIPSADSYEINSLLIDGNGNNILGQSDNVNINVNGLGTEIVFAGGTMGWVINDYAAPLILQDIDLTGGPAVYFIELTDTGAGHNHIAYLTVDEVNQLLSGSVATIVKASTTNGSPLHSHVLTISYSDYRFNVDIATNHVSHPHEGVVVGQSAAGAGGLATADWLMEANEVSRPELELAVPLEGDEEEWTGTLSDPNTLYLTCETGESQTYGSAILRSGGGLPLVIPSTGKHWLEIRNIEKTGSPVFNLSMIAISDTSVEDPYDAIVAGAYFTSNNISTGLLSSTLSTIDDAVEVDESYAILIDADAGTISLLTQNLTYELASGVTDTSVLAIVLQMTMGNVPSSMKTIMRADETLIPEYLEIPEGYLPLGGVQTISLPEVTAPALLKAVAEGEYPPLSGIIYSPTGSLTYGLMVDETTVIPIPNTIIPIATASNVGLTKPGNGLTISEDGALSITQADWRLKEYFTLLEEKADELANGTFSSGGILDVNGDEVTFHGESGGSKDQATASIPWPTSGRYTFAFQVGTSNGTYAPPIAIGTQRPSTGGTNDGRIYISEYSSEGGDLTGSEPRDIHFGYDVYSGDALTGTVYAGDWIVVDIINVITGEFDIWYPGGGDTSVYGRFMEPHYYTDNPESYWSRAGSYMYIELGNFYYGFDETIATARLTSDPSVITGTYFPEDAVWASTFHMPSITAPAIFNAIGSGEYPTGSGNVYSPDGDLKHALFLGEGNVLPLPSLAASAPAPFTSPEGTLTFNYDDPQNPTADVHPDFITEINEISASVDDLRYSLANPTPWDNRTKYICSYSLGGDLDDIVTGAGYDAALTMNEFVGGLQFNFGNPGDTQNYGAVQPSSVSPIQSTGKILMRMSIKLLDALPTTGASGHQGIFGFRLVSDEGVIAKIEAKAIYGTGPFMGSPPYLGFNSTPSNYSLVSNPSVDQEYSAFLMVDLDDGTSKVSMTNNFSGWYSAETFSVGLTNLRLEAYSHVNNAAFVNSVEVKLLTSFNPSLWEMDDYNMTNYMNNVFTYLSAYSVSGPFKDICGNTINGSAAITPLGETVDVPPTLPTSGSIPALLQAQYTGEFEGQLYSPTGPATFGLMVSGRLIPLNTQIKKEIVINDQTDSTPNTSVGFPHGLGNTPSKVTITSRGDYIVYQSAYADDTNIYVASSTADALFTAYVE